MKAEGAQKDELKTQLGPGVGGDTGCAGVCRTVEECGISASPCKDPPVSKVPALPSQSKQSLAPVDSFPPCKEDVT